MERIVAGEVDLVLNTPRGAVRARGVDGYEIRTAAVGAGIPCLTTVQAAAAAVQGIEELVRGDDRGALAAGPARPDRRVARDA